MLWLVFISGMCLVMGAAATWQADIYTTELTKIMFNTSKSPFDIKKNTFLLYLYYMTTKRPVLFFLSIFICLTCVSCGAPKEAAAGGNLKKVPQKSFVKVFKKLTASQCITNKKKKKVCNESSWVSTGSGISISLINEVSIILTAGHVCKTDIRADSGLENISESITVLDYRGNLHQGQIILSESDNGKGNSDLCAVLVPSLEIEKVSLSRRAPRVGEELYYMGAPLGVYHPPTVPIFKGIFSGRIDSSSSMVTVPASGGSSGAGILNSRNQLVGILYAVHPRFHHISVVSAYKPTLTFLDKVKNELNAN